MVALDDRDYVIYIDYAGYIIGSMGSYEANR